MANFSGSYDIFQIEIQDELIQKAIDAVGSGGTIYLKEGVYKGPVTIDKSVNIFGADSGETFIDGNQQGSVFTIGKPDLNVDVELSTFTIRGGSSDFGGGINNFGRLTLEDILITGNTASNSGGGIFNHGSTTCTSVKISDNSANSGAGIFNDAGSFLALDCIYIESNIATTRGGGILNNGNMDFKGGTVFGNRPDDIAGAGALQPAASLAPPRNQDICGQNDWLCSKSTCAASPYTHDCLKCAGETRTAWSDVTKKCMMQKHVCCNSRNYDCNLIDSHNCNYCICKIG
jgi:hypothetical protein